MLEGVDRTTCRRLVVQKSVVVPARSHMDIQANTIYINLKATRSPDGMSWMTETGTAEHGLQVAAPW